MVPPNAPASPDLPLPHLTGEPRQSKVRPPLLKWVILADGLQSVVAFAVYIAQGKHRPSSVVLILCLHLVEFLILVALWRGRRWARYLMLAGAFISPLGIIALARETGPQRISNLVGIALGMFLLWWLNTKSVADFFRAKGDAVNAPLPH